MYNTTTINYSWWCPTCGGYHGGTSACSPCKFIYTYYPSFIEGQPGEQKPYKCPICDGTGLVSRPPGVAGDQETQVDNQTGPYECRPCLGSGVLWR